MREPCADRERPHRQNFRRPVDNSHILDPRHIKPQNAIRSIFLAKTINLISPAKLKYRGCNMAFWRSDLLAVNGYDESFLGWGCEDHDLVARLMNHRIKPLQVRHRAICYHLWHPSSKRRTHSSATTTCWKPPAATNGSGAMTGLTNTSTATSPCNETSHTSRLH